MEKEMIKNKLDYMEMLSFVKLRMLLKEDKNSLKKIYGLEEIDIEKLDQKLYEEILPNLLDGLIYGKYDYEWTMKDCIYNEKILLQEPKYKIIYKRFLEIMQLERQDRRLVFFGATSLADSPVYFDVLSLIRIDKRYYAFFKTIMEQGLYNPNQVATCDDSRTFAGQIIFLYPEFASYILLDKRTDFNLEHHGSNIIDMLISETERKYMEKQKLDSRFPYLLKMFKEMNVSIIDALRTSGLNRFFESVSYIDSLVEHLKKCPLNEVQDLFLYIVSEQGIEKQLNISKYPSLNRDYAIDTYCELISERRNDKEGIARLKSLKLYD